MKKMLKQEAAILKELPGLEKIMPINTNISDKTSTGQWDENEINTTYGTVVCNDMGFSIGKETAVQPRK